MGQVTEILGTAAAGGSEAFDELYGLLYAELRKLAHARVRQAGDLTVLGTTALVHETYLRFEKTPSATFASVHRNEAWTRVTGHRRADGGDRGRVRACRRGERARARRAKLAVEHARPLRALCKSTARDRAGTRTRLCVVRRSATASDPLAATRASGALAIFEAGQVDGDDVRMPVIALLDALGASSS